ncbi:MULTISPECIES: biotin transporter BioY [Bacillaceae]|uniref:Biotin transporter n=1 Tax=Evansella alkalicola TaxID=745819 RepID=A0ABS6JU50_9BACI|nr:MULTISPECIES: biotin transporter BioY [Bacillaceae]MBU9722109.1 biotin transporter BioY [Bacillus alkalicola]
MAKTKNNMFTVLDLTKAAMFIALMGIGANITAFITVGAVPLTFQTVIAILAGVLLGKKVGAFSMIGYTIIGLIGVPVFAGFQGGMHNFLSPTFGFVLSFIILAFFVGWILEIVKPSILMYLFACYIGLIINYAIGVPYLYLHQQFILNLDEVTFLSTSVIMAPFFVKDFILTGMIALVLPRMVKAINRSKSGINNIQHSA